MWFFTFKTEGEEEEEEISCRKDPAGGFFRPWIAVSVGHEPRLGLLRSRNTLLWALSFCHSLMILYRQFNLFQSLRIVGRSVDDPWRIEATFNGRPSQVESLDSSVHIQRCFIHPFNSSQFNSSRLGAAIEPSDRIWPQWFWEHPHSELNWPESNFFRSATCIGDTLSAPAAGRFPFEQQSPRFQAKPTINLSSLFNYFK